MVIDWNVCDWLCVRILTPLLDKEPELVVSVLSEWNKSPNLWKARASLVPFAQSKSIAKHNKTILQFSSELIKRQERFCKTAVGWVLREYSKSDTKFVAEFLEQFKDWITKEVIKNATKYIVQKKSPNC
jgi:3-methyladenine DNA glycosylase AlkD